MLLLLLSAYHCAEMLETNKNIFSTFSISATDFEVYACIYVHIVNLWICKHWYIETKDGRGQKGVEIWNGMGQKSNEISCC